MPSKQCLLLSPTELAYLHTSLSLSPPIRPDSRSPNTFRPLNAESDLLPSANGSARLCFADGMEGIVGVKAEVERTTGKKHGKERGLRGTGGDEVAVAGMADSLDRKAEIHIIVNSEWVEVAIDMPGQHDEDSMAAFLAQMIHEGLVADEWLPRRLFINQKWHWKLYIDVLLFSAPASYPLPLLSLSTHLALLSTRLPALVSQGEEDPLFNDDWDAAPPLYPSSHGKQKEDSKYMEAKPPVTMLVISLGSNIFFDPSREELAVADSVFAVTLTQTVDAGLKVLAIRTIDPPSRHSISSSPALGGDPGFGLIRDDDAGIWKPSKGGTKRALLGSIVKLCIQPGGVGHELIAGLEAFH